MEIIEYPIETFNLSNSAENYIDYQHFLDNTILPICPAHIMFKNRVGNACHVPPPTLTVECTCGVSCDLPPSFETSESYEVPDLTDGDFEDNDGYCIHCEKYLELVPGSDSCYKCIWEL